MKKFIALVIIITMALVSGCSAKDNPKALTKEIYGLDTIIELTVYNCDQETLSLCGGEIHWLEGIFSKTIEGSDISRINENSGDWVEIEDSAYEVLKTAYEVSENTKGAFDITISPAVSIWGFDSNKYTIPEEHDIASALEYIDYKTLEFDDSTESVRIGESFSIDLGGIAKGYVADYVADFLREEGVSSAMLNFGGNICLIGSKPDKSLWNIGIKAPFADGYFATVSVADKTISTAGGYERYFEENGEIYHHIMDPHTASPAKTDVLSSTVIGENGTVCDALSTAVFVKGSSSVKEIAGLYPELDFVVLTEDSVFVTENISKNFALSEGYEDIKIINI
ncbi:MAG: FAD:protein FMN transferase [Ruminococcaceae bacterium]|nr:FAD:protein FMN transferase [Oscillospiraceae bacterium]